MPWNRDIAKVLARGVLTPIVALTCYFTMPFDGTRFVVTAGLGVTATLLAVPYAVRRIITIRQARYPLAQAFAVISLMVSVIVVGFAAGYYSLSLTDGQMNGIHTRLDALYFTIVTIGTVGFGDITPASQGARALVSIQIMLNLTLIATIIRLLGRVAAESRQRSATAADPTPPT